MTKYVIQLPTFPYTYTEMHIGGLLSCSFLSSYNLPHVIWIYPKGKTKAGLDLCMGNYCLSFNTLIQLLCTLSLSPFSPAAEE
jgi:hypothetical protein